MTNHYRTLGIPENATDQQIRQAFRMLAKRYHPDVNPNNAFAADKFREIAAAYEILSDPFLRSNYDKKRLREALYTPGPFFATSQSWSGYTDSTQEHRARYSESTWRTAEMKRERKQANEYNRRRMIFIVMIPTLILFIAGGLYFDEWVRENREREAAEMREAFIEAEQLKRAEVTNTAPEIIALDSPFDTVFGPGIYDEQSPHSITLKSPPAEAVVCLVQAEAPWRTIRNEYVTPNFWFTLRNVPEGRYTFKLYTGRNWQTDQRLNKPGCGGFTGAEQFVVSAEKPLTVLSTNGKPVADTLSLDPQFHHYKLTSREAFFAKAPVR